MRIKQLFEGMMDDNEMDMDWDNDLPMDEPFNDLDVGQGNGKDDYLKLDKLQVGLLMRISRNDFDPDRSRAPAVEEAINQLMDIGAITDQYEITRVGYKLLQNNRNPNLNTKNTMDKINSMNRMNRVSGRDEEEKAEKRTASKAMNRDDFGNMSRSDRTDDGDFKW